MARGDLLLYRGDGTLASRLICWRTLGPYHHVAIDLGGGWSIEAQYPHGVALHQLTDHDLTLIDVLPLHTYTDEERIEAGIAWAQEQKGAGYSVPSLFNFLLPRFLRLVIGTENAYICSSLAARYVDIAGGLVLKADANPDDLSPNDLFRAWLTQHPKDMPHGR